MLAISVCVEPYGSDSDRNGLDIALLIFVFQCLLLTFENVTLIEAVPFRWLQGIPYCHTKSIAKTSDL